MGVHIGVLGGSFDPIHAGHVAAAETVRSARGLDRVDLVVAAQPPHKSACVASFVDRVQMARLAVAGRPGLAVSDAEGGRDGPSYTFYTVTGLSSERVSLLVGADMLADLPSWHRAEELVAAVEVVGFARPGFDFESAQKAFEGAFPGARLACVEVPAVDVSSTEIRRRLAAGEPVGDLLPPGVEEFIRQKGLYGARERG